MSLLASVKIRVPASTSNLGPGFDSLGLALTLYNRLTLELHSGKGPARVILSGEGDGLLPLGEKNLMVRAARRVLGRGFKGRLVFKAHNAIPLARGLGSSAAAILAGLCAASALPGARRLSAGQMEEIAVRMEGHPDNVAASLRGGLVVSLASGRNHEHHHLKTHKDLTAAVCVPDFQLSTKRARAVLPKKVSLADAAQNVSRSFLLSSALSQGDWEKLPSAMEDRLHQPYRASLVPGLKNVIAAAQQEGRCGSALSGAGPSVVALGPRSAVIRAGKRMSKAFARKGITSRILVLRPDLHGIVVGS